MGTTPPDSAWWVLAEGIFYALFILPFIGTLVYGLAHIVRVYRWSMTAVRYLSRTQSTGKKEPAPRCDVWQNIYKYPSVRRPLLVFLCLVVLNTMHKKYWLVVDSSPLEMILLSGLGLALVLSLDIVITLWWKNRRHHPRLARDAKSQ